MTAAGDVRAFYRDFVLPNREVWVTGDPVEAFLAIHPSEWEHMRNQVELSGEDPSE